MFGIGTFVEKLFSKQKKLNCLEQHILGSIRDHLAGNELEVFDKQIETINRLQRLPGGVEVNLYRIRKRRPVFDPRISFNVSSDERKLADVVVELVNENERLAASVWCVKGLITSIEYDRSPDWFIEAASIESGPKLIFRCELWPNGR